MTLPKIKQGHFETAIMVRSLQLFTYIWSSITAKGVAKRSMCLYLIRCLGKEGYQQPDVDYVFRSIVLPKLRYGLRSCIRLLNT